MRKLATAALAVSLFIGGVGTTFAQSWHPISTMKARGVSFAYGAYTWWPKGQHHGGFQFQGSLQDTDIRDSSNIYVEAKVEGYNWRRFNGVQRKRVHVNKLLHDGAAQRTTHAWIRACRDRGTLRPDNCSVTKYFQR